MIIGHCFTYLPVSTGNINETRKMDLFVITV
jgi:hypothetical protein